MYNCVSTVFPAYIDTPISDDKYLDKWVISVKIFKNTEWFNDLLSQDRWFLVVSMSESLNHSLKQCAQTNVLHSLVYFLNLNLYLKYKLFNVNL